MLAPRRSLLGRIGVAVSAALGLAAILLGSGGASAGGAHHLLEALEPPREVAPRAVTMTEAFELVVVVDRGRVIVVLDDAVSNAAIEGAAVELEVGGRTFGLAETAPGIYSTTEWLPAPGLNSLMFSVTAGDVDDLLITDLKLDGTAQAAARPVPVEASSMGWWRQMVGNSGYLITVLLVGTLLAILFLVRTGRLPSVVSRRLAGALPAAIARQRRD